MNRLLVTVAVVGATAYSVYLVSGGTVAQQLQYLQDAGYTAATHRAECPVVFSDDCLDAGRQAGFTLHRYERLAFPVAVRALPDGGVDVQLPPMAQGAAACLTVTDWTDCTLSAPRVSEVAGLLGSQVPFTTVNVAKQWVRAKWDAGLPCPLADGGSYGDRNVYRLSMTLDAGLCELVGGGVVFAGADPESDL